MDKINNLVKNILEFRDKRNWKQFHNSKDLSLALSIEAAELNELFLWKDPDDADRKKVKEELADIFIYTLLIAENYKYDIIKIAKEKLKINNKKYPVSKSKDSSKKYNQF
jgi:NTP pyrophosphatase (non-canonical NTP hydrolase)